MRRAYQVLVVFLLATFWFCTPASAQFVIGNFGPGDSFDTRAGYTETGPDAVPFGIGAHSVGVGFIPDATAPLESLTVAISHLSGTDGAHLFLSDGSTGLPGTTLESFTLTNLPVFGSDFTPQTLYSTTKPTLNAGTTYYLYEYEAGDEFDVWNNSLLAQNAGILLESDNGVPYGVKATTLLPAFRVTLVPEPNANAFLALLGLGSLGWLSRRRLHASFSQG